MDIIKACVKVDKILEASTLVGEHLRVVHIAVEGLDEYMLALGKSIFVQYLCSEQVGLTRLRTGFLVVRHMAVGDQVERSFASLGVQGLAEYFVSLELGLFQRSDIEFRLLASLFDHANVLLHEIRAIFNTVEALFQCMNVYFV